MAAIAELLKLNPFVKRDTPPPMTAEQANDALQLAICTGEASREELADWLAAGADPNFYHKLCSFTLLHEAVIRRRSDMAIQMLDHLEAQNIEPALLHWMLYSAIDKNQPELVERLLCMGASPDAEPKTDQRPLVMDAIHTGYPLSILQSLINHGAKLDYRNPRTQDTILHYAVETDRADVIEALLNAGMDVDATDYIGQTPLHIAARGGYGESLKALLKAGANVDARDDGGNKPLHLAVSKYRVTVIKQLALAGADLNERCMSGLTPMCDAQQRGHRDMSIKLIVLGARIDDELRGLQEFNFQCSISAEEYHGWLKRGCDVRHLTPEIMLACGNIGKLKDVSSPALWRGHEEVFAALSNKLPPYIVTQMLAAEPELAVLLAKPKPVIEGWSAEIGSTLSFAGFGAQK